MVVSHHHTGLDDNTAHAEKSSAPADHSKFHEVIPPMETDTEPVGEEFFEVKQAGPPNEAAATDVAAGSDEASGKNSLVSKSF